MPTVTLFGCERIAGGWTKFAMINLFVVMVTFSGLALPLASTIHSRNCHPFDGVAVSETAALLVNVPPAGLTKPWPLLEIVKVYMGASAKLAVIVLFVSIATLSGFEVPLVSPLQDANIQPDAGMPVSVTTAP